MSPLWFLIPAGIAAYLAFACLVGRLLRHQQPNPPKGDTK